ncbi:glycerol-3-phosphate cytidylyltransferase [Paenibacillus sp. FSL R5-0887]|jgi:glycerol-3-phosphate cytidylyltransferase|uniref:glycerol-3-phosphate cytidylyltransferase n=1 Tax=Paenibacillus sp. FSL R5-0887 TaxID=2921662 RepID=UPI0030F9B9BC
MKKVITYGTFDLLHYGHILLFQRARALGDHLTVALSTDEFNTIKQKVAYFSYEERKMMLEAIKYVDEVIPEQCWEQKKLDIAKYNIDVFVMGDDWHGKFDELKPFCEVIYLERTPDISTTSIKTNLKLK